MVKYDPHNHKKYYESWKTQGHALTDISEKNRNLIITFLGDFEIGANVNPSTKKGGRSYGRLRNLKSKLHTMFMLMEEKLRISSVVELEKRDMDVLKFFKWMREGQLRCRRIPDRQLTAIGTYARVFKTFWHWYQRSQRKAGRNVDDITLDLDSRDDKPKFNYFTIDQLKKLCNGSNYDYKVMMMFMFDAGIRSPTELMNVRPKDLEWNERQNFYTLHIREETSKTFGRKIKLLLCSDTLKDYLAQKNIPPEEYIFKGIPQRINQNLKVLGYNVLKIGKAEKRTSTGRTYCNVKDGLTMYDFRHSSACYWLPRYKSESALKYRFGWKKSEMIHYYTELLGMHDTIEEDDLYTDISKTELEKQMHQKTREIEILSERLQDQDQKMQEIMKVLKALELEKIAEQQIDIQTPT
ncbi:MAG: hypothetical protein V1735_08095 [Nanoarchaeota archaeon]